MASRLPALTGKEVIRALRKAGFVESRQRGSHVMLVHPIEVPRPSCRFTRAKRSKGHCYGRSLLMRELAGKSSSRCFEVGT